MTSSAELTLGRPCHGANNHGTCGGNHIERILKLEYYLKALEDERRKIDAFKRELPFCMQLLNDEIEASKEQLADYREPQVKPQPTLSSVYEEEPPVIRSNMKPIYEEFMPIKRQDDDAKTDNNVGNASKVLKETKWNGVMETAFWNSAEEYAHDQEIVSPSTDRPYKKREMLRIENKEIEVAKQSLDPQKGGAFMPFCGSKRQSSEEHSEEALHNSREREASPLTSCADTTRPSTVSGAIHQHHMDMKCNAMVSMTGSPSYSNGMVQGTQRKPRRCWSPELHRRFVNALQQLGGSEVATPKQIRELMKVDGLTNDEVKSHLQKYRLHTRRPNPTFHGPPGHTPQVVVLGGIWVPPEYAAQAASTVSQAATQPQEMVDRQKTHVEAISSFPVERHPQVSSTVAAPLQIRAALCSSNGVEARHASIQSQNSSQAHVRRDFSTAHSDGERGEESLGEEGSSWKEDDKSIHRDGDDARGVRSMHVGICVGKWLPNKMVHLASHESGEDDSEAEDGKVYETAV
ncbi:hypothetical protein KP509_21G045700 [Ceratopteris richardii]|uniref:HTH myb-type domain-containing protein n=1 Tax=Ceratopteris richardii TaxID=49495 RepID=A0A8T2SBK7_CERRI|nr:hypothetical protein KP509_21G045700 [Ceratopteris richardii]